MSFQTRFKEQREAIGMSRAELARRLGVTTAAIGNYETGVSTPKADILFNVFDALQCDANYLFQDETRERSTTVDNSSYAWARPLDDAYAAANAQTQENICKLLDIPHIKPK